MPKRRKFKYHNEALPPEGQDVVFVFDSNLAGLHKVGNSDIARRLYNAEFGIAEGITSANSYAIPFKDRFISLLTLREISARVDRFAQYTISRPELTFWVSLTGVGHREYKSYQIAPMFKNCGKNCVFPHLWIPYLR